MGFPDAVKVGPSHMGPPRRHSRPRHKTGRCPPHLPHGVPTRATSTTKAKDPRTLRGPLDPEAGLEVPGPRRPAGGLAHPGNQPPVRKEDKLACPSWRLLEDLGAKKMVAPHGDTVSKGVSRCPPALQKVGDRT